MKLKIGSRKITPEAGVELAGYGIGNFAEEVHDDLYVSGMLFDDGEKRALLLGYDLLGIDAPNIQRLRKACSEKTSIPVEGIILTCTHVHAGPHTRSSPNMRLNVEYIDRLVEESQALASELTERQGVEVDVLHYSAHCAEGVNRRVTLPDSSCASLFKERKALLPFANGVVDEELGLIIFLEAGTSNPAAVLVNFAAHPLSSHAIGRMSKVVTADYPGVIRDTLAGMGIPCVFTSGACGDIHPRDFEGGFERTREMGLAISREVVRSATDAISNKARYLMEKPSIKTSSIMVELGMRQTRHSRFPLYNGLEKVSLELQFIALGDVCLVGVPGELLTEPGLEIKWHSPFRKTYILYNSTAYISYICHANAFVGGAYEANMSQLEPRGALKMVNAAVDEMFNLKERKV